MAHAISSDNDDTQSTKRQKLLTSPTNQELSTMQLLKVWTNERYGKENFEGSRQTEVTT